MPRSTSLLALACALGTAVAQVPLPTMVSALQVELQRLASQPPAGTMCGGAPGPTDSCLVRAVQANGQMRSTRHDPNRLNELANSWGLPSEVQSRLQMIAIAESTTFQTFSLVVNAPGGYGEVSEYIGAARRFQGLVEVAIVNVHAVATLHTQHDAIQVKDCKRTLGIFKSCSTRTEYRVRGFSVDEIDRIQRALRSAAYQKLVALAVINPYTVNHFYTTNPGGESLAGYVAEGIACYVWPQPPANPAGTTYATFWRYLKHAGHVLDHFYTTSREEGDLAVRTYGYRAEGATCVLATANPPAGAVALHRLLLPSSGNHFYTTSVAERDNAVRQYGYDMEGVAGYCMPQPGPGLVPLYRYSTSS